MVDLDGFGRGIDVRLEPGADEGAVMERLRTLLAAYGIRRDRKVPLGLGRTASPLADIGIQVAITPMDSGARIEVGSTSVKSFRIVAATPLSIAQGLVDAWCQVVGRVPIEIVTVAVDDQDRLVVTASDGERETDGSAPIQGGWLEALIGAIRDLLGDGGMTDLRSVAS